MWNKDLIWANFWRNFQEFTSCSWSSLSAHPDNKSNQLIQKIHLEITRNSAFIINFVISHTFIHHFSLENLKICNIAYTFSQYETEFPVNNFFSLIHANRVAWYSKTNLQLIYLLPRCFRIASVCKWIANINNDDEIM